MRILLVVYDNGSFIHWFPQGFAYIAAVLRKEGYKVEIYSQDKHHYPDEHLTEYLNINKFDVIGVSVIAGYYQYQKLISISNAINESKNRPFYIIGGHGPSPEPEYFLKKTKADLVVIGEGEETIIDIVDSLANHRPLDAVNGIAFFDGKRLIKTEPRGLIRDIDTIPFPAYELFPMDYYRLMRASHTEPTEFTMPILTGRGCTFKCNFCYRMDKGFRPRSSDSIIEEINLLKSKYSISRFIFADELLMSSERRAEKLCEEFIKSQLSIKWCCNGRLNYAKPKLLKLMKKAGCVFINYGIESMDDTVLKNMNKKLTVEQIEKGIKETLNIGISPGFNIIFGNIGETKEILDKGIDFLLKYDDGAQLRTVRPVTPYPGCDLYYYAIKKGLLNDCEDFYENKHVNSDLVAVNFTDMTDEEFHRCLLEANSRLIQNYFNNMAATAIKRAKGLYIEKDVNFRGFRQTQRTSQLPTEEQRVAEEMGRNIEKTIWLDLLCWESFVKIVFFGRTEKTKIYYCQVSKLFSPFVDIIQVLLNISLVQITDFVLTEEYVGNSSVWSILHARVEKVLNNLMDKWEKDTQVNNFVNNNAFNILKVKQFLYDSAFYYLYRPIEVLTIAEIKSKGDRCFFIFRKTPFSDVLKLEFGNEQIKFFRTYFSHYFTIMKRDTYYYDKSIQNTYFANRIGVFLRIYLKWAKTVISAILVMGCRASKNELHLSSRVNIGVEQLQRRFRADDMNDLFWFKGSSISPESIYNLESQWLDSESGKALFDLAINRLRVYPSARFWIKRIFGGKNNKNGVAVVCPNMSYIKKPFFTLILSLKYLIRADETNWKMFQLMKFKRRVAFFQDIYAKFKIRILWSMHDIDSDKLAKAQALENLDGLFCGSHWSNYPQVIGVNNKCYDVLFAWGPHFANSIFNRYYYQGVFLTGYPSDHHFNAQKKRSQSLGIKYPGKFIVSYFDNACGNDITYGLNMQLKIYSMFLSILETNDGVMLLLKPKAKGLDERILKEMPIIRKYIRDERIAVFSGDPPRTKIAPAVVGMASDLAVGLGISSAAAECYFAGTLAFHADLTGFLNNEFAIRGFGKVVFRDVESLREAIQDCIGNGTQEKYEEYKNIYRMLDPFQDGKAYKRVGFVLRNLQDLLSQGLSREEAVGVAHDRYELFLREDGHKIDI